MALSVGFLTVFANESAVFARSGGVLYFIIPIFSRP